MKNRTVVSKLTSLPVRLDTTSVGFNIARRVAVLSSITKLASCSVLGEINSSMRTPPKAPTTAALPAPASSRPLVRANRLETGDTVMLVSPSGVLDESMLASRVTNLESLGFKVRLSKNLLARWGGYGGTIEQRVSDLHDAFADPSIKAVWAARGGSGATGLLPYLNYELIRANPKVFIGFSDITALHLAFHHRAGLITFHGPTGGASYTDYTVRNLQAVLMNEAATKISFRNPLHLGLSSEHAAQAEAKPHLRARSISNRAANPFAHGELWGGNLSLLASLVGTPFADTLANKLLFLEDVGEVPYRTDRLLTQLQQSVPNGLNEAKAVMLGVFARSEPKDADPSLSFTQVIEHHLAPLHVPAAYGFSFGHEANQLTLPLGIQARIHLQDKTLTLLQSAVV